MRHVLLLTFLSLACDMQPPPDATGSTGSPAPDTTGGSTIDLGCPVLCLGDCTPECIPSVCITIGDACTIANGDQQCGDRMGCLPVTGIPGVGVCAQPCAATLPCIRGECKLDIGVCLDGDELVTPIECMGVP